MKKIVVIFAIVLACALTAFSQQPAVQGKAPIKIPVAQAEKIKQAEARIADRQREIETLRLLEQNALLEAALELGLTKKELEGLSLALNDKGELVMEEKPLKQKP